MGFKAAVVGCGAQGRVISYFFAHRKDCDEVTLSDIDPNALKEHAANLESDKVRAVRADASDPNSIEKACRGSDVVVNAVIPRFNLQVMSAALKAGANYVDMAFGPPYDNLEKEMKLSGEYSSRGLIAVTGAGKTPGLSNLLVARATDRLDRVSSVTIRVFGELVAKIPILTWSPQTLAEDCALPPTVLVSGIVRKESPFSGEEEFRFPVPGIGTRRVWLHEHEEAYMFQRTLRKFGLRHFDLKMGGIEQMKALYDLGLLSDRTLYIHGAKVETLKLTASMLPKPPTWKELLSMIRGGTVTDSHGCMVVDVRGVKNGRAKGLRLWVTDPKIRKVVASCPMATDDSYVVAMTAATFAVLVAKRKIPEKGIVLPEELSSQSRNMWLESLAKLSPPVIARESTLRSGFRVSARGSKPRAIVVRE